MSRLSDDEEEGESIFDSVKTFLFGKALTPEELVKKWKRELNAQRREIDRSIRAITREEEKIKREIRVAARNQNMSSARLLANEIVRSRKAKERMSISKAQINSVGMALQHNLATYKMAGCIKKSTEVMKMMNSIIKLPELQANMMTMMKEMERAGLIEEMIDENLELTDEIEEEDVEEEVNKVLTEFNLEVIEKTPATGQKLPPKPVKTPVAVEEDAGADADLLARYQKMKE